MTRKIKKIMTLLVVMFALVNCISCSETGLRLAVEVANKECPMDIEGVGKVTSISYEGNSVVYNCVITEEGLSVEGIKDMKETVKAGIIDELVSDTDKDSEDFLDQIVSANANVTYNYMEKGGANYEIVITPEDIRKAKEINSAFKGEKADEYATTNVDEVISVINKNLDDGMSCHKEGSDIVIVLKLGPQDASLSDIRANKKAIKKDIMSEIAPGVDQTFELCVSKKMDLVYRYVDKRENSVNIRITSDEIKARLSE